ncbi:glycosyltransferase family 34 protein [Hyaloscypha variabilis]|uniref:Glycosyltransferase family 34 protein n=1 Tax=Hyaloscypha variabilis (strain UAMH 11265 / GT02V1 / F) TaxID=1149755 RepID=A0A2J6S2K0_HYAVF|nr:glycosyltransferase family 34 protein [Hyaloscypha variabilis F]
MHLAMPTRKSSNPPPYATRSTRFPMLRRSRVQAIALCACAVVAVIFILSQIMGGSEGIPSGTPPVVIVTVVDSDNYSKEYINNIKDNRIEYARKHGYTTFFPSAKDYELNGSPNSWARVPAIRHALTKFPHSTYMWYLDQNSLIMNPDLTVEGHIMNPKRLEALMIRDQSIVPPDSVIKTFGHLKGNQVDFVLTQDKDGLAQGSFIIRRGEWSKFFLDTWFDPLYRSYNFQKADTHALEHIVQWHPTILSKLALIPQRIMNAYSKADAAGDGTYKDGDLVIRFAGCDKGGRDCAAEAEPFSRQWKTVFRGR